LEDTGPHVLVVGVRAIIPDLEVAVGKVRHQKQIVWTWECGLQFIKQADVSHFFKRLGVVEENRRAECASLKVCHDLIDNSMPLLDREVAGSKAKLVARDKMGKVHMGLVSLQEEFLKDLRHDGEKADRAIGCNVQGRFARFWHHYDLCKFPHERVVG
jgi:hypothetical protein